MAAAGQGDAGAEDQIGGVVDGLDVDRVGVVDGSQQCQLGVVEDIDRGLIVEGPMRAVEHADGIDGLEEPGAGIPDHAGDEVGAPQVHVRAAGRQDDPAGGIVDRGALDIEPGGPGGLDQPGIGDHIAAEKEGQGVVGSVGVDDARGLVVQSQLVDAELAGPGNQVVGVGEDDAPGGAVEAVVAVVPQGDPAAAGQGDVGAHLQVGGVVDRAEVDRPDIVDRPVEGEAGVVGDIDDGQSVEGRCRTIEDAAPIGGLEKAGAGELDRAADEIGALQSHVRAAAGQDHPAAGILDGGVEDGQARGPGGLDQPVVDHRVGAEEQGESVVGAGGVDHPGRRVDQGELVHPELTGPGDGVVDVGEEVRPGRAIDAVVAVVVQGDMAIPGEGRAGGVDFEIGSVVDGQEIDRPGIVDGPIEGETGVVEDRHQTLIGYRRFRAVEDRAAVDGLVHPRAGGFQCPADDVGSLQADVRTGRRQDDPGGGIVDRGVRYGQAAGAAPLKQAGVGDRRTGVENQGIAAGGVDHPSDAVGQGEGEAAASDPELAGAGNGVVDVGQRGRRRGPVDAIGAVVVQGEVSAAGQRRPGRAQDQVGGVVDGAEADRPDMVDRALDGQGGVVDDGQGPGVFHHRRRAVQDAAAIDGPDHPTVQGLQP